MIPPWTLSGLLPPFIRHYPSADTSAQSPYASTWDEFASTFGVNAERMALIECLRAYRADLVAAGFDNGFQLIGGSLVESKAAPRDIDVVTCVQRGDSWKSDEAFRARVQAHRPLFDRAYLSEVYSIDGNFVDLAGDATEAALSVSRWILRYSISKPPFRLKGIVLLPLLT